MTGFPSPPVTPKTSSRNRKANEAVGARAEDKCINSFSSMNIQLLDDFINQIVVFSKMMKIDECEQSFARVYLIFMEIAVTQSLERTDTQANTQRVIGLCPFAARTASPSIRN